MATVQQVAWLFIDTSVFEKAAFCFDGPLMTALATHGDQGNLILLLPVVTRKEVASRIRARVAEARVSIDSTRKRASLIKGLSSHKLEGLFEKFDHDAVANELISSWEKFLARPWVKVIPLSFESVESIIDDYFSVKPPFGVGKRKEFPDAFALHSILRNQECANRHIKVISLDDDLRQFCQTQRSWSCHNSLESVLAELTKEENEFADYVHQLLDGVYPALDAWAVELANEIQLESIDWEYYIVESKVLDAEVEYPRLIEIDGEHCVIAFSVNVKFKVLIEETFDPRESRQPLQMWDVQQRTVDASLATTLTQLQSKNLEHADFGLSEGAVLKLSFRPEAY